VDKNRKANLASKKFTNPMKLKSKMWTLVGKKRIKMMSQMQMEAASKDKKKQMMISVPTEKSLWKNL
jgi:hypothetical protein